MIFGPLRETQELMLDLEVSTSEGKTRKQVSSSCDILPRYIQPISHFFVGASRPAYELSVNTNRCLFIHC